MTCRNSKLFHSFVVPPRTDTQDSLPSAQVIFRFKRPAQYTERYSQCTSLLSFMTIRLIHLYFVLQHIVRPYPDKYDYTIIYQRCMMLRMHNCFGKFCNANYRPVLGPLFVFRYRTGPY